MEIEFKKTQLDSKFEYNANVKRALVLTLLLFLIAVNLSPRVNVQMQDRPQPDIEIQVEDIPVTRQTFVAPPPLKPAVPVPSEVESIPEDATIEPTTLSNTNFFADVPDGFAGPTASVVTPPKPISWVFPEYPKEVKKKGIRGVVRLSIHINEKGKVSEVVVLENTTGSKACADAAIAAAYDSRFFPAKQAGKAIDYWMTQPYRFDYGK